MPLGLSTFGSDYIGGGIESASQETPPVLQPVVTGVVVSPPYVFTPGGLDLQFFATVTGRNQPSQEVTWETDLGVVDEMGTVTGLVATKVNQIGKVTARSVQDPTVSGFVTFEVASIPFEYEPEPSPDPEPDPSLPPAVRFARPARDVSKGLWSASTGTDLFAMLGGIGADDTYISTTSTEPCELALAPVLPPLPDFIPVIRYQAHAPSGGALVVELFQGADLVAAWEHTSLPPTPTVYERMLTPLQHAGISDYTNLRVKLRAA